MRRFLAVTALSVVAGTFHNFTARLTSYPRGELEVFYLGAWVPVCGQNFWNNEHGAITACQAMGYRWGTNWVESSSRAAALSADAMQIGQCNRGDALGACTGLVDRLCSLNVVTNVVGCNGCMAGDPARTDVECIGRPRRVDLSLSGQSSGELRIDIGSVTYPVCGLGFRDNDNGAEAACQALGYSTGKVVDTRHVLSQAAYFAGRCAVGEAVDHCTAGVSSCLSGSIQCGACGAGQAEGVEVVCLGARAAYNFANLAPHDNEHDTDHNVRAAEGELWDLGQKSVGVEANYIRPVTVVGRNLVNNIVHEWSNQALQGREFVHAPDATHYWVWYRVFTTERAAVTVRVDGIVKNLLYLDEQVSSWIPTRGPAANPFGEGRRRRTVPDGSAPPMVVEITSTGNIVVASWARDANSADGYYAPIIPVAQTIYGQCSTRCNLMAFGGDGASYSVDQTCTDGSSTVVSLPAYFESTQSQYLGRACRWSAPPGVKIGGNSCDDGDGLDCTAWLPADYFQLGTPIPVEVGYVVLVSNQRATCTDGSATYRLGGGSLIYRSRFSASGLQPPIFISCNEPVTAIANAKTWQNSTSDDELNLVVVPTWERPSNLPAGWGSSTTWVAAVQNYGFEVNSGPLTSKAECAPGWTCSGSVLIVRSGSGMGGMQAAEGDYFTGLAFNHLSPTFIWQPVYDLALGAIYALRFELALYGSSTGNAQVTVGNQKSWLIPLNRGSFAFHEVSFRAWSSSVELRFEGFGLDVVLCIDRVILAEASLAWIPVLNTSTRVGYDACLRSVEFGATSVMSETAAAGASFEVGEAGQLRAIGLSVWGPAGDTGEYFMLSANETNSLLISDSVGVEGGYGSVVKGDTLSVHYRGARAVFLKNGAHLHSIPYQLAVGSDFYAFASIYQIGGEMCELTYVHPDAVPVSTSTTTSSTATRSTYTTSTTVTMTVRTTSATSATISTAAMSTVTTTTSTTATATTTTLTTTLTTTALVLLGVPVLLDNLKQTEIDVLSALVQAGVTTVVARGDKATVAASKISFAAVGASGVLVVPVNGTEAEVAVPDSLFTDLGVGELALVVSVLDPSAATSIGDKGSSASRQAGQSSVDVKAAVNVNLAWLQNRSYLRVSGLSRPIQVVLPINVSAGLECAYWHEQRLVWASDGMTTGTSPEGLLSCTTTHLSLFAGIQRGFLGAYECSQAVTLLNAEAVSRILEGDWYRSVGAIALWSVLGAVLLMLLCMRRLDRRRRKQNTWHDEHFLIPLGSEADSTSTNGLATGSRSTKGGTGTSSATGSKSSTGTEEEAVEEKPKRNIIMVCICCPVVACCACCRWMRQSSAIRDALDDIMNNWVSNFSEIRDTVEGFWEGMDIFGHQSADEGGRFGRLMHRIMRSLLLSTVRRQTCSSLYVTSEVVTFLMKDEDVTDILLARHERHRALSRGMLSQVQEGDESLMIVQDSKAVTKTDCGEETTAAAAASVPANPSADLSPRTRGSADSTKATMNSMTSFRTTGREENWGKLHDSLIDHLDRHMVRTGWWRTIPCIVSRIFVIQNPIGSSTLHCVFMSSSLRFFLFVLELIGALMLATIFFQATGGFQGRRRRAKCGSSTTGPAEYIGRIFAIAVASLVVAGIPVAILNSLHSRSLKKFDYEGSPDWHRQLRIWRIQDRLIWCLGSIYFLWCIWFMCLFMANVSDKDIISWSIACGITIGLNLIVLPFVVALFVPVLAAAMLSTVSCVKRKPKRELLRQSHAILKTPLTLPQVQI